MVQFEKNLKKYLKENEVYDICYRSVEDTGIMDDWCPKGRGDDFRVAVLAGMNHLVLQTVDDFFRQINDYFYRVTSPIEIFMLLALSIVGRKYAEDVRYRMKDDNYKHPFGLIKDCPDWVIIEPQAEIGEYRVDFLIEIQGFAGGYGHVPKGRDGKEIPSSEVLITHLVVECNGHDYHEKTKEQARKDKERDRNLQMCGYQVFRFAGSEIWRDPFDCAEQVFKFLQKEIKEKRWA